jgi:DNA-directed RNA polymerase subunit H (RpoH/RPB5)
MQMKLEGSRISFLVKAKIHNLSRIVVSNLPDEKTSDGKGWIYCYQCDIRLNESNVPRVNVLKYENEDGIVEAKNILESLLVKKGRRLTSDQWEYVLQQIKVEPTSLYLNLTTYIVSKWSDKDIPKLESSIITKLSDQNTLILESNI